MKISRRYLQLLFGCLLMCSVAPYNTVQAGGVNRYFNVAEKAYNSKYYRYAIQAYKRCMADNNWQRTQDSAIRYHIADSYWAVRNYDSARLYFTEFIKRYGCTNVDACIKMSDIAAAFGDYQTAEQVLKSITGANGNAAPLIQHKQSGFADIGKLKKDSAVYKVSYLAFNSPQQDFSPQFYKKGIVFTSGREVADQERTNNLSVNYGVVHLFAVTDTAFWATKDTAFSYRSAPYQEAIKFNDDQTYYTSNDNNTFLTYRKKQPVKRNEQPPGVVVPFYSGHGEFDNIGPICFSPDQKTMYYTSNNPRSVNGVRHLQICWSVFISGDWRYGGVMPFVQNAFDYFHPALSADGKRLYFCSNQPGGAGGTDIYSVELTGNIHTLPAIYNERTINTSGNELFPTTKNDTLFFSSNGYAGLGGLDIYASALHNGRPGEPVNVGYPVNSGFDDYSMVYAGEKDGGLFCSNRLGSEDIFSVFKVPVAKPVPVAAVQQPVVIPKKIEIDTLTNRKPLVGITGEKPLANFDATQQAQVEELLKRQQLDSVGQCIQRSLGLLAKHILFKTASAALLPESIPVLDSVYNFIKDKEYLSLLLEGNTDSQGKKDYNRKLSMDRALSVRAYLIKKGIRSGNILCTGYGPANPISDNDTPEGRQLNRRVEIRVLDNRQRKK